MGGQADLLNYSQDGGLLSVSLASRWSNRWRTSTTMTQYWRFGQTATGGEATVTYLVRGAGAVTIGGGSAGNSGIAPTAIARVGYEQGFRRFDGLYEQRWIWYPGTRILSFSPGAIAQLPRNCDWLFRFTSTRIDSRGPSDWTPSLQTRFTFPVRRWWKVFVLYAGGAENFGTVDQILFRSSRTAGGGFIVRTAQGHELRMTVQREAIAGGRSQNSFGAAYAIRF
jgi:hypothetical protein